MKTINASNENGARVIFKSILLFSLLLLFLFPIKSFAANSIVSGRIKGLTNDTLFISLSAFDSNGKAVYESLISDTLVMKEGWFSFEIENDYFTNVNIIPAGGTAKISRSGIFVAYLSDFIELFVDKGEKITVDANYDGKVIQYTLKGSPLVEMYSDYRNQLFEYQRKRFDALKEIAKLREAKEPIIEGQSMLKAAMDPIRRITSDFIENNLNSPITPHLIYTNYYNDTEAIVAYSIKLGREALESPLASEYKRYLNYAQNSDKYKREAKIKEDAFRALNGKPAPDFSLRTIDGKELRLSSLKGRYLVLKFWGSWCGWCLESMPKLLEYHQKYRDNIVVIAIACSDKEDKWRNTVSKFKMEEFINVFDIDNSVSKQYSITEYPTYVLITPEGTAEPIDGYDIFKRLDQIFGKEVVEFR